MMVSMIWFVMIQAATIGSSLPLVITNIKILAKLKQDGAAMKEPTPNGPMLMVMERLI